MDHRVTVTVVNVLLVSESSVYVIEILKKYFTVTYWTCNGQKFQLLLLLEAFQWKETFQLN